VNLCWFHTCRNLLQSLGLTSLRQLPLRITILLLSQLLLLLSLLALKNHPKHCDLTPWGGSRTFPSLPLEEIYICLPVLWKTQFLLTPYPSHTSSLPPTPCLVAFGDPYLYCCVLHPCFSVKILCLWMTIAWMEQMFKYLPDEWKLLHLHYFCLQCLRKLNAHLRGRGPFTTARDSLLRYSSKYPQQAVFGNDSGQDWCSSFLFTWVIVWLGGRLFPRSMVPSPRYTILAAQYNRLEVFKSPVCIQSHCSKCLGGGAQAPVFSRLLQWFSLQPGLTILAYRQSDCCQ
jgi:hypothetical protein